MIAWDIAFFIENFMGGYGFMIEFDSEIKCFN